MHQEHYKLLVTQMHLICYNVATMCEIIATYV